MTNRQRILWWVVIAIGFIALSHVAVKMPRKEYTPTIYRAKGQFYVAASKADMQKAVEYKVYKDSAVIALLLREGRLFHLRPGAEVYRLHSTFSGLVKIRPKGSTEELWTYREEITE